MSTQISGQITQVYTKIKGNIGKVIVGKSETLDMLLVSLLCGGHVLLEDVPGTGKTVLIKSLAASVSCQYKRIQFTPDLLPSDITGVNFFNVKKSEFEFVPGPIFANIVLADEINRATPKTQSGLLECMEEIQATIDGKTYKLAQPFMVVATQNPVENMGTFPLPEAQLDRFLMKGRMEYPTHEEGVAILDRFDRESPRRAGRPRPSGGLFGRAGPPALRLYALLGRDGGGAGGSHPRTAAGVYQPRHDGVYHLDCREDPQLPEGTAGRFAARCAGAHESRQGIRRDLRTQLRYPG